MHSLTRTALGVLAVLALAAAGAAAQSATRIGYVNSQRLLPQAPGFADAQAQIETQTEGVKAQEQKMSDSLAAMVADYERTQATMTSLRDREDLTPADAQQLRADASELGYIKSQPTSDEKILRSIGVPPQPGVSI